VIAQFYFLLQIVAPIETVLHLLAVCAIPLALLLSGALIADHINKESLRHGSRTIFASIAVRIGALPALILLLTKIAPLDLALKSVLVVQAAMPAAIFPIVVTKVHHGDMPTALQVVLGTSVIGLITIPLWTGFGLPVGTTTSTFPAARFGPKREIGYCFFAL
jgi:malate permease and related proteins